MLSRPRQRVPSEVQMDYVPARMPRKVKTRSRGPNDRAAEHIRGLGENGQKTVVTACGRKMKGRQNGARRLGTRPEGKKVIWKSGERKEQTAGVKLEERAVAVLEDGRVVPPENKGYNDVERHQSQALEPVGPAVLDRPVDPAQRGARESQASGQLHFRIQEIRTRSRRERRPASRTG